MRNSPNRVIRADALHEVNVPNFKRLKAYCRAGVRFSIRRRIAAENAATRETPDSWADIESKRAQRMALIKQAAARVQSKLGGPAEVGA